MKQQTEERKAHREASMSVRGNRQHATSRRGKHASLVAKLKYTFQPNMSQSKIVHSVCCRCYKALLQAK